MASLGYGKYSRLWEILPGLTSWTVLALPVVFSFVWPAGVAYFIILFDAYWLTKALIMGGHLLSGYSHMKRDLGVNWRKRLNFSENLVSLRDHLISQIDGSRGWIRAKFKEEISEVEKILSQPERWVDWRGIYHAVIFATYKESYEVLAASIEGCLTADYPKEKMIIILATEGRAGPEAQERAQRLKAKYGSSFKDFIVTIHPDGIPGEMKAKGANATWAGRILKKYIDENKIPYERVVVSIFDADTVPSKQYFSCLTYKYVINPERLRRSFQPIPLFNNNIWDVPAMNRLVAFSSSFWQMIESTRPYRLVNFSSQALSLQTLVDIDFWDVSMISEDSRTFYRAFFKYGGDHQAIPVFTPVSMDAVLGSTYWATLKAQYRQKQRWAYGIENFPYIMQKAIENNPPVPLWKKFVQVFRVFEGHVSWATASLLIALGGWMPLILNPAFRETVIAFNLPILARNLLTLTWIGVIVSAGVAWKLLPPRPKKYGLRRVVEMFAQWILVPIAGIIFGSIAALDAETRIMFGRYLGAFTTTEKHRREAVPSKS